MDSPAPLHKRLRRMNLFDMKDSVLEGIGYMEEILESGINVTVKDDKGLYTPLQISRLKTEEYTPEDVENSTTIVCLTTLDHGRLCRFLERLFRGFRVRGTEDEFCIRFCSGEHATACLYLSNEDFSFHRPRNYVELPNIPDVRFSGSKYCTSVPSSEEKILLGPLDVDACVLRDCLDEVSRLQSFRRCTTPGYFVFTFQNPGVSSAFVRVVSHIFVSGRNQALVCEKAYKDCVVLNLSRNMPSIAPRRMAGAIVLSKEQTRIVVLMNVVGPWDMDADEAVEAVRKRCTDWGDVRRVVAPRTTGRGMIRQAGDNRIFVECGDLETSRNVYSGFGGMVFEGRVVASGYYPEMSYFAGEYE